MNSSANCGLKGQYKVNIYNRNRELVEAIDWFDNDITNVGMNYPYYYSFARCFSFLSLGLTAAGANRALLTGLPAPSTGYFVNDGNGNVYIQNGTYIGWPGYELGSAKNSPGFNTDSSTCGTTFTNQGINFYRGWTIPTGLEENPGSYLNQNLNLNSFMVSPSSGSDPLGKYAFSIVDKPLTIPSGFSATVTYQLSLNFPTYSNLYNVFKSWTGLGIFNYTGYTGNYTGNPSGWFSLSNGITGTNGSETGLLGLWGNLSGIYRQIYPGIELVNPLGACIIPARGNQLEPYITSCPNLNFYLSPDFASFAVNEFNQGGPSTGEYGAYNSLGLSCNYIEYIANSSTGTNPLSPNVNTNDSVVPVFPSSPNDYYYSGTNDSQSSLLISNESPTISTVNNIRLNNLLPVGNYNSGPLSNTYATTLFVNGANIPTTYANAGSGLNTNFTNYGQRAIISSYLKELPNPTITSPTGANTGAWNGSVARVNSVNKKGFFPPILSLGTNSRYGSLTLGYNTNPGPISTDSFSPYIDFLFFDTSGRIANMPHYRYIPYIYLSDRGSGVAQVLFSITGANKTQSSSVSRFWNAAGFMGPYSNSTTSGLDINHPMYLNYILDTNPSTLIPPGNLTVGYTFPGEILPPNALGNDSPNINGGTGWGSVYGVVATTGFYQAFPDCGLIDIPSWTGYGGIPNPTGTSLFWPVPGSGLGLLITGMQYYLKGYSDLGYGNLIDINDNYSSGTYQVVGDILLTGTSITSTGSFFDIVNGGSYNLITQGFSIGNGNYQAIYLTTSASAPNSTNVLNIPNNTPYPFTQGGLTFENTLHAVYSGFTLTYITGTDNQGYVAITGFTYSPTTLNLSRGSGNPWGIQDIYSFLFAIPSPGNPYIIATGNGTPIYMTLYDGVNGGTFYPVTGANSLSPIPSQYFKPKGTIAHYENINLTGSAGSTGIGNRLLPNYAYPNNVGINTYTPYQGGQFPGLSTENGMEIYLNFLWSG